MPTNSRTSSAFYLSELEKEVQLGLDNCDNPHKRCVLVLRDIVDVKNYVDDPRAPCFMELVYNEHNQSQQVDLEAENRLLRLRNRARGLISNSNTLQHEVLWRFEEVIHPTLHQEYLDVSSPQPIVFATSSLVFVSCGSSFRTYEEHL